MSETHVNANNGTQPDYTHEFEEYIRRECLPRINEIAEAADDDEAHYGLEIDLMSVGHSAPHVVTAILNNPYGVLPQLENAIREVQTSVGSKKKHVHARICHLPATPQTVKRSISALRTRDLHKLISIIGTVTRTGSVMLREEEREFVCSRCKHAFIVAGDITQRGTIEVPLRCPKPGENQCYGNNFTPKQDIVPICQEYQEIKIQEKVQHLEVGSIPRSLIVILTNDLADTVKPGDDVVITGVLHRRWNKNLSQGSRVDAELMLVAFHVASNNDHKSFLHVTEESRQLFAVHWASTNPRKQLEARNLIIKSICPQIYGMYLVKLIVAMTLTGGVSYTDPSGTRIRGESHLLMVGDPGTAKSQILRYAAKVSPRSVLTTGIGTTSAGLTVTAVREPGTGEWMLDAGALVLADAGVCCIDEFDSIKQHDRGAIHEAMEQQTLSVAKAGLVCTLDTRATVIAAVNPKGGRISTEIGVSEAENTDDDREKLPITVGIASPLLSRFDVVLTLLDQRNEDWDRELSRFILNGYKTDTPVNDSLWSTDRLRQYFYFIKNNLKPRLSSQCQRILSRYYTLERSSSKRNAARTTVRLLEALVRLAQAHARLMFRETATPLDAVFAIAAVEASSATQEVVGGMGALHGQFPEDPLREFEEYCRYLLCRLGLDDEEIDFYYDDAPVQG